ncbi:FAD-dependent oxidoreductase [Salinisphaera sp. Q1T1-3]|uniref:FAD-dependent oxidoreductase n=1 Tax=Salinisphaera sp. Q1T1-3 TaxID=2321229 RepID=UPI000E73FC73|nr:FAD-dependent oxidoreductase [Salinisphaera sp. Q1T1-3]RJS92554.1 FAD-dependent oxidoreductase [Salinisphaera sp. Q1T1-3]
MSPHVPIRLILVGGGHAHVGVLRRLAGRSGDRCQIEVVTPDAELVYSGMLPGWIAGHYARAQTTLSIEARTRRLGAFRYPDTMVALDPDARTLTLSSGRTLTYDMLSLDTGGAPVDTTIDALDRTVVPAKPVDTLMSSLARFERRHRDAANPCRVAVVGGGVGGVELMLSLVHRWALWPTPPAFRLVTGTSGLLPDVAVSARQRLRRALQHAGVILDEGARMTARPPGQLVLDDGRDRAADLVVAATGARAPDWARASGLAVDARGFIAVDWTLQSISHPGVFAAGDLAALPAPRPKSGVFAVREAPVLADNLVRATQGQPLRVFSAQRRSLALVSLGDRRAIAIRGRWSLPASRYMWHVKDAIDRRFVRTGVG